MRQQTLLKERTVSNISGPSPGKKWGILGTAYICIVAFGLTFQSVPPILSLVMSELNLTYAQAGLLMSFFALPGIIFSIPAGLLADRHSQRIIGTVALILMAGGSGIVAVGNSFPILALGRVVSGIGGMTVCILMPQIVSQWFKERELGTAMGIFQTAMPVGAILSLSTIGILAQMFTWRFGIWVSAILSLAALVVFLSVFTPIPNRSAQSTRATESVLSGLRSIGTPIWLVGAAWLFFNASTISLFTFTPDLLQSAGLNITTAGFYASMSLWGVVVFSPIFGLVIDKTGRKKTLIVIGSVAIAATMVWVPKFTGAAVPIMLIFGVAQSLIPVSVFAMPPELTRLERVGLAFGILYTGQNIGVLIGPWLAGLLRDATGSYQPSYFLMATFSILVALITISIRKSASRRTLPEHS